MYAQQEAQPLSGGMRMVAQKVAARKKTENRQTNDLNEIQDFVARNPDHPIAHKFMQFVDEVVENQERLRKSIRALKAVETTVMHFVAEEKIMAPAG